MGEVSGSVEIQRQLGIRTHLDGNSTDRQRLVEVADELPAAVRGSQRMRCRERHHVGAVVATVGDLSGILAEGGIGGG